MKMEQHVHPLRNLLQKWRWEKYFSWIIFIAICGISNVECKLNSENSDHYYDLNIWYMLVVYDNDVFLCTPFMNAHAIANIL